MNLFMRYTLFAIDAFEKSTADPNEQDTHYISKKPFMNIR